MAIKRKTKKSAVERFLDLYGGSQAEAARAIGLKQPSVWAWLNGGQPSAKNAIAIERVSCGQITRYELRPDIFGEQEAA